ncbi:Gfo/Idh/MocA family protein [Paenibacillus xerothermodurans]|uniref:Gfo/Idh/MocA family oxidoreductase n=1 Tax=Paenibacillus xerothermodurans TaxID=1977292 RepID=A0A2W1NPK1_PAEXE|nr:Gfo/Idh/MocA family oxidoreductase [Paenibacillus xerothermodurans]PZE19656.1 gfo/Idh/MocA family oxidoreductase [Paenibacillus xerothermodurans]
MKKYRVGLIGAGGVTELHLEGYKQYPERVEVAAICDPNQDVRNAKAKKYGITQQFDHLQDFIQHSNVDVAVVCTPTSIRRDVVLPLLQAGYPLYVEKPFSDTLSEAIEITTTAQQLGIPIAVNQNFRRHYPFQLVKQIVAQRTIGNVTAIIFNNLFFRQDVGWRLQCERHALSVMGIHWFDGFRQILGCEAKSVSALMSSSPAIDCVGETDATVQLEFENGTIVTYTQSFSSAYRRTEMVVVGEIGTLQTSHAAVELFRAGEQQPVQTWSNSVSRESATFEGLNHLLISLETGTEAPNSAQDNLRTVAMLDAAYVSAKEKRIVHLNQGALV